MVDVAFSHELPHVLDGYAKEVGSSVIWDVGIAPGLSNMLVADALQELGHLDSVNIMVGGNPFEPDDNWSYMAPFSPADVIEEYTRPARILQDGNIIMVPALSEKIEMQHGELGILEGWITDGLRSLVENISCRDMKEYTLRWPGHIEKWLRCKDHCDLGKLLDEWRFNPTVKEFTWLRVEASASDSTIVWDVFDKGADDGSSMSRTTGLVTAATLVYLLEVDNELEAGVFAPEHTSPELENLFRSTSYSMVWKFRDKISLLVNRVGPSGFEPESKRPKRPSIGQANPRAPRQSPCLGFLNLTLTANIDYWMVGE